MTGYDRAQYESEAAKDPFWLVYPEDMPLLRKLIVDLQNGVDSLDCVYRNRTKTGGLLWLNFHVAVSERIGEVIRLNAVMFDVTSVKLAEEALRVHEEELGIAMSQMGKMICEYDVQAKTLTLPEAYAKSGGLRRTIANVPDSMLLGNGLDKKYRQVYADFYAAIARGEKSGSMEYREIWRDGSSHWSSAIFSTIFDSAGKPVKAVIAVEDTTGLHDEHKQAELERERMYTALANLIPMAISVNLTQNSYYMISYDAYTTKVAPEAGAYDELIAIGVDTVPEPDKQRFYDAFARENLLRAFAEGKRKVELEHRQLGDDGNMHWILTQVFRVDNPFDSDVLEVSIARDITEQKNAQALLQKTYDLTLENMPGFVSKWLFQNGDVLLLDANQKYLDFMGVSAADALGKSIVSGLGGEERRQRLQTLYDKASRKEIISFTNRTRKSDGSDCWLAVRASYFEEKDGCAVYFGTTTDVTELILTQEELRIRQEEYKLAATLSNRMVLRCDVRSRRFTVLSQNDDEIRLSVLDGKSPEVLPTLFNLLPESVDVYRKLIRDIEQGVASQTIQLASVESSGRTHWAELSYNLILDMNGRPATAIISVENITEKREKEAVYKRWQQSIDEKAPEDYTLFRWNLSTDKAMGSYEGKLLSIDLTPMLTRSFDENTAHYAAKHVYAEDRADFTATLRSAELIAAYRRGIRTNALEYREKAGGDTVRWLHLMVELVEYPGSTDVCAFLMFENIDEAKKSALLIRQQAELDPLTGVLNRATFAAQLDQLIKQLATSSMHPLFSPA